MSTANATPPRLSGKRSYDAFSTPPRRSLSDTEAELDTRFKAVSKIAYEKRRAEIEQGHSALMAQWQIMTVQNRRSVRRLADAFTQYQKPIPCSEEIESCDDEPDDEPAIVSPPKIKRFKITPKNPFEKKPRKLLWFRPKLKLRTVSESSLQTSEGNKTQALEDSSSEDELLDSAFVRGEYKSEDSEDSEDEDESSPKHILSSALSEDELPSMMTCSRCSRTWDGNAQCPCDLHESSSDEDSDDSGDESSDEEHPSDDDDETNKENYFTSQEY